MNNSHSRPRRIGRAFGISALTLALATLAVPLLSSAAGADPTLTNYPSAAGYGYAASDSLGNVYVADYDSNEVYRVAPNGDETPFAAVENVWAIAVGPNNDVYANNYYGGEIYEYAPSGALIKTFSGPDSYDIYGLAVNAAGDMFYSEGTGYAVWELTPQGTETDYSPDGGGMGLAFDSSGNLFAAGNSEILETAANSGAVSTFYTNTSAPGYYSGIAIDAQGNVFVVGYYEDEEEISPSGVVTYLGSTGVSDDFWGLAVAPNGVAWTGSEEDGIYSLSGIPYVYGTVSGLATSTTSSSITAEWFGTSTSYTCTLVYGFNSVSGFTSTTNSNSCTFSGLGAGNYGISVVPDNGVVSVPQSSYATIAAPAPTPAHVKTTIACKRGKKTIHVTGFSPKCPSGYSIKK